jgi:general secretion pathway protein K
VSRRRESGVALVAALAALAVLSAIATSLATTARLERSLSRHAVAAVQADALLRSGAAAAAVVLRETVAGDAPDTLRARWAADAGRQPLGAGSVTVRIEDEARRIDLGNPALLPALGRLAAARGLDPAVADAIADWIDTDDVARPRGAERDAYRRDAACGPRNAPFAALDELTRVRGVTPAVLAALRPWITTAGEQVVNPNTAAREVLVAVLGDEARADRVLAARARGPLDADAIAALLPELPAGIRQLLAPRGQRYRVTVTAEVGGEIRRVEATLWAPAGVEPQIIGWRPVAAE